MPTIHPSPVSDIDPEELAWLHGKLWYVESPRNLVPLDRGYIPGAVPAAPLEQQTPWPATWSEVALLCVATTCGLLLWAAVVAGIVRIISNLKG